jgi:uncharacterized protein (TIGR00730 family)
MPPIKYAREKIDLEKIYMAHHLRTLTIYCGSRSGTSRLNIPLAQEVGQSCAAHNINIVYGGGALGLMGEMARAAMASGAHVTGIIPDFLHDLEVAQSGLTEMIRVKTMHERKALMVDRADAIACLPGGPGTLDEMIEVMTWASLGLHAKPCYLIDPEGYWQPVLGLIDHMIAGGFSDPRFASLITTVPSLDALVADFEHRPAPGLQTFLPILGQATPA